MGVRRLCKRQLSPKTLEAVRRGQTDVKARAGQKPVGKAEALTPRACGSNCRFLGSTLAAWLSAVRIPALLRLELVIEDVIGNAGPQQGACVLIGAEVDASIDARIRDVIGDLLKS